MQRVLSPSQVLLLAALGGAVGALAFTPWNGFCLALGVWAAFFWLLDTHVENPLRGSLVGGAFGLGFFGVGVSWVYVSLHEFGGMSFILAALATFLFCALLAAFHALFAYLFIKLRSRWELAERTPQRLALLFGTLWGLIDWLRGWIFSGFPWLSLGYSQLPPNPALSPLAGYFPLLGVFGVSLLTALCAALLVNARKTWGLLLLLLLGGAGLGSVSWTEPEGDAIPVALVQGNIPQSIKWDPVAYADTLAVNASLTVQGLEHRLHPRLVVLPETAFPSLIQDVPLSYLAELRATLAQYRASVLFGIVTGSYEGYQNSAVAMGEGDGQQYHKSHLVPFGETIPFAFRWFLSLVNIPLSDFTPGVVLQAPLALAGTTLGVNICYEDIFGEEIIRALPAAKVLVNLSNTAWFGDSLAQPQHLQISRVRAVETGRPMLRATNTGMTAWIRQDGYIEAALPPFERGVLVAEVQGYAGTTPYVRWGNGAFLLLAASFLFNLLNRRTSR